MVAKNIASKTCESVDDPVHSFLNNLTAITGESSIKVRITRLWDTLNIRRKKELMSTDMVLTDEKSNCIHATIPSQFAHEFRKTLQEGEIYVIKKFNVTENKKKYVVVEKNPSMLQFHSDTEFTKEDCDDGKIPLHVFEFVEFEKLEERIDKEVLTDVIGVIIDVDPIEEQKTVHGIVDKLTLKLKDIRGNTAKVTLWDEYASIFEETLKRNMYDAPAPNVAVITSVTVKRFQGDACLNSTRSTKIYINNDIPSAIKLIPLENTNELHESGEMILTPLAVHSPLDKTRTISEILSFEMSWINMDTVYYCCATINDILDKNGWYYVCCPFCKKAASADATHFKCERCSKDVDYPITKYRLEVDVKNSTNSTIFVLFDEVAEQVTQVKLGDLTPTLENENGDILLVPQRIKKIIGTTHIFQVRMKSYYESHGRQSFTVSKIVKPKVKVEKEDKSDNTNVSSGSSLNTQTPKAESDEEDMTLFNRKLRTKRQRQIVHISSSDEETTVKPNININKNIEVENILSSDEEPILLHTLRRKKKGKSLPNTKVEKTSTSDEEPIILHTLRKTKKGKSLPKK